MSTAADDYIALISIHALHEESDWTSRRSAARSATFQSTLSMRRATKLGISPEQAMSISIHALHEESDHLDWLRDKVYGISIHALHEESDPM